MGQREGLDCHEGDNTEDTVLIGNSCRPMGGLEAKGVAPARGQRRNCSREVA